MSAGEDSERSEGEVAAFRDGTAEPLPPLTEKIDRGRSGAHEFERLMQQLLQVYAGQNQFVYGPAGGDGGDGGIDGIAKNGIPGCDGVVAFQFEWVWDDVDDDGSTARIRESVERATKSRNGLRHWILVTPRDLKAADTAWLATLQRRRGPAIHHWGQARIEQMLRECPALLARYYPHAARAYLPGYEGSSFVGLAAGYREKVAVLHNRLKTIGIPPEARPRESRIELPLAELFIPLRFVPEGRDATPMDLACVLEGGGSAVVLADPGMGKSTLLAYLALVFAGGAELQ